MTCGDVTCREALQSEAERLAEIRVAAMRPSLEAIGRFDPQRARDRLLKAFNASETTVIEHMGRPIGFYVVRAEDDHHLLDHLYLLPEYQGAGLGSTMLRKVFAQAELDSKPVRLGALKSSRSNEFYQKHGFKLVEVGEWDNFYVRPVSREA